MRIGRLLAIGMIAVVPAATMLVAMPARGSEPTTQIPTTSQTHDFTAKQVEHLQLALTRSGHEVAVDGIWGKKTTEALRAFQKERGLKVTGFVNPATVKALPVVD